MGIRPATFIEDSCGCEGFTPPLPTFNEWSFLFRYCKSGCHPHGRRQALGSVSLLLGMCNMLASKTRCALLWAYLQWIF